MESALADVDADTEPEPVVTEFKSRDDPMFKKPDHDPHGEVPALAARSSTSCDGEGCETYGLVPTATLEYADGIPNGPKRKVLCEECGEALDNQEGR